MNKKISIWVTLALLLLTVALTVSVTMTVAMRFFNQQVSSVNQRQAMFDYLTEVDKLVRQYYVGDISEEALRAALAEGYVDGVGDPYADYLTADEYQAESERLAGKHTGYGLEVARHKDGTVVVATVHAESAADKAGVRVGDVLTAVDGTTADSLEWSTIQARVAGQDKITLTVDRDGTAVAFDLSASVYEVTTVTGRLIGGVGYIRISALYSNTTAQFKKTLEALETQGATGYVFDLRNNSGGLLNAATDLAGYLLPRGTFGYATAAGGEATALVADSTYELAAPAVVLVNGNTRGEAELVAGALQAFQKTTVVGERTAGKGLTQQYYTISLDGAALKLSVASLSLADNTQLEGRGVQPSVEVALSAEQAARFELLTEVDDPQLGAGLALVAGATGPTTTTTTTIATDTASTTTTTQPAI